jgi:hypothetical protein
VSQTPEAAVPAPTAVAADRRLPILLAMAMFVLVVDQHGPRCPSSSITRPTSFRMMRQPDPVSSGIEGLVLA